MRSPADPNYLGREHALAKHDLLRFYLESLAWKVLFHQPTLTFIDAFAGPWNASDLAMRDTSFGIALEVLAKVQRDLAGPPHFRRRKVRCIFNEAEPDAFRRLDQFVHAARDQYPDIDLHAFEGRFEANAEAIALASQKSFRFLFVDPKGWTGFPLESMRVLTDGRGELLLNLMTSHMQRFLTGTSFERRDRWIADLAGQDVAQRLSGHRSSIDALRLEIARGMGEQLGFRFVCHSPITAFDTRSAKYWLLYATRSIEGVATLRAQEFKALHPYETTRAENRAGDQPRLFNDPEGIYSHMRAAHLARLDGVVLDAAQANRLRFGDLAAEIMTTHHVRETEVKDSCCRLASEGRLRATWKDRNGRRPDRTDPIKVV